MLVTSKNSCPKEIEKFYSKDISKHIKIAILEQYRSKQERIQKYKEIITEKNNTLIGTIIFNDELLNEVFDDYNLTLTLINNLLKNEHKLDTNEYKLSNSIKVKYITYLCTTEQYSKVFQCDFKLESNIVDYVRNSRHLLQNEKIFLTYASFDSIHLVLTKILKCGLYEKIIFELQSSASTKNSGYFIFKILKFIKDANNSQDPEATAKSVAVLHEIIKIISCTEYKNPRVMCELLKNELSLNEIKDLLSDFYNILDSQMFVSELPNLNQNTIKLMCDNFGTKILTKNLVEKIAQTTNPNSIFINLLIWLQQIFISYGHITWATFDMIESDKSKNKLNQQISTVEEIVNVDISAINNFFQTMTFDGAINTKNTNIDDLNSANKIHDNVKNMLTRVIKIMTIEQQEQLSKDLIELYQLQDFLHPEIAVRYCTTITKKMTTVKSLKYLIDLNLPFDDEVKLLEILARYKENDFGEVASILATSSNTKSKFLGEIMTTYKKYDFNFMIKLCEFVPDIMEILYNQHILTLNKSLNKIGCIVTIDQNSKIDYVEILKIIYNVKHDDFTCKICENNAINITCKVCGHVMCDSCQKTIKTQKCPYCQSLNQSLVFKF